MAQESLSEREKAKILLSEYLEKEGLPLAFEESIGKIINCESGWRHDNVFGKKGEYGILQYRKSTFEEFCEGDWKNMEDQISCGVRMLKEGRGGLWTCFK